MVHGRRALAAATVALLGLLVLAATAFANRTLEYSQRTFTFLWAALAFTEPTTGEAVTCRVNLVINLAERRHNKMAGMQVGTVAMRVLEPELCREGIATVLGEGTQRWALRYQGFAGVLPAITRVRYDVERVEVLISAGAGLLRCLYALRLALFLNIREGRVTSAEYDERGALAIEAELPGSMMCPPFMAVRGTTGAPNPATTLRLI